MSIQSSNPRDTPLRRFSTFWCGLACFGLFGIVSTLVVCLSDRSPSVVELKKEERQKSVDAVFTKQADLLVEKEIEPGKTKQLAPVQVFGRLGEDLKKSPQASAVKIPQKAGATIGDAGKGKELFKSKTCFTCHGADGNAPIAPIYPKLGGKEANYLAQKMKDIKSGAYVSPLSPQMKPFIDQVSDEEINDIAQWLADGSK